MLERAAFRARWTGWGWGGYCEGEGMGEGLFDSRVPVVERSGARKGES